MKLPLAGLKWKACQDVNDVVCNATTIDIPARSRRLNVLTAELPLPELFAITSLTNMPPLVACGSGRSKLGLSFAKKCNYKRVFCSLLWYYTSALCSCVMWDAIWNLDEKYAKKNNSSSWERYSGWLMPTCLFQEPKAETSSCLNKYVSTASKRWMLYLCVFISFNLCSLPLWIKNQDWKCLIDCGPPKAWQRRVFGRKCWNLAQSATVAGK